MSTPLLDPLKDLANWTTVSGTPPIIATGRTGQCATFDNSGEIRWPIPAPDESATIIVGFAFKMTTNVISPAPVMWLWSDSDATRHTGFRVDPNRAVVAQRSTGTQIGSISANGVIPLNTWCYIETKIVLGDSPNGAVTIRVNGTAVLTATSVDTKNAGTKTVFDRVHLSGPTTSDFSFDDLYVASGAAEPFKGDTTISEGVNVNVWNGSAFAASPIKTWNGSAFADALAVKTWDGSAFV